MPYIYSIEGNIGSGKSTFIRTLRKWYEANRGAEGVPEMVFVDEPVDDWMTITDRAGKSILEHFYEDQDAYAFSFQMMAFISRLQKLRDAYRGAAPDAVIITERCNHSDKHVFAKMLHDDGKINDIEHSIYLKWFDYFLEEIPITGYFYIRTDPLVAHFRVKKRSRDGEEIPLGYLSRCAAYHDSWIATHLGDRCVRFSGDDDMVELGDYMPWIQTMIRTMNEQSA
jgi:deoxyadenosine/deoxycytidine kinase